jgi:hypothetical protein
MTGKWISVLMKGNCDAFWSRVEERIIEQGMTRDRIITREADTDLPLYSISLIYGLFCVHVRY